MRKFLAIALVAVLLLGLAGISLAAAVDYPKGVVAVIVPFSAGGGTDLVTRAAVEAAKAKFPKGISVENRTGGGGAIGMVYGATAKPDGGVLTTITVELTTLPHTGTGGNLKVDQFKPVIMMNSVYSVVSVQADSPYKTLADLIEAAKTKSLQVGNSGVGAIWHLSAAALEKKAGVEFLHVPFEGAAPAITSILGGHIDFVTVSYPEVAPQVDAGKLRVLAVLAPERFPAIPDVPTAKELGYDVVIGSWRGIGVPAATPDDIADAVYAIFSEATKSQGFIDFMNKNKLVIDIKDPKEFKARIDSDYAMFEKLIKDLGLNK